MRLNTDKITREYKRIGWSMLDLAKELGVSRQWVSRKLKDKKGGTYLYTVEKFAKALDMDPKDLIK